MRGKKKQIRISFLIIAVCVWPCVRFSPPSVPVLVLAGLFTLSTCVFVICFRTRYRRLEAEERAVYGQQPGGRTSTEEEDKDK